jgi:two-component sensor histidine kinase/serine/threonine protein kinase
MIIPNYEILEKVAETSQTIIYKAFKKRNPGRLLALKVLKTAAASEYKIEQFRQRVEHLKVLTDPAVITPIGFVAQGEVCFISQDWFEGISLDRLYKGQAGMLLPDFFAVAGSLVRALGKVHEAGVIHASIKPHNILVNPGTLETKLTGLISVFDVRDVSHFIYDDKFIRETLSYTSPEQTGRISHRVGFSSDLYCLGVVFFEMLTGRLPFSYRDPLELIHSHLAEQAPDCREFNAAVPPGLSRIIAKLLLKQPEKRYQSDNGLLTDLAKCRDQYDACGEVTEFPLEAGVQPHKVVFISKMVGRDVEAETILELYEQVAQGQFRSLFISGLSGIGKTRLIQELQKPIVKHRGYFTSGKFDVYQKNIPYSSLIQAFRNLIRTFLTESDERVAAWRRRISNAVEKNGRVLTDAIPELEILIGPQPEVKPLPPVEALNRFHDVFDRFLGCLAIGENPLALFIDDLQWCDSASFDFLTNVFANCQDHPYLFLLGAYRHNEVDTGHPLTRLMANAASTGRPLREIRLGPLKPEYCHEMVSYILDTPLAETKALADFISSLSEGNPLFVSESLSYLYNEALLYLAEDRQWRWDMGRIRLSQMPNSVVALFGAKIRRMPQDLIALLEYCACMGNVFAPAELSLIREMSLTETYETLKPALGAGLLIEAKGQLQFIHDKVQEAALSEIPRERRRLIHRQIGNHLLAAAPSGVAMEKLENLFAIASHLNMGCAENPGTDGALLSDLNYHAGNKALDALATEAANEYYNLARQLLPADCWGQDRYERTFRIYQKTAKTELMCGNYTNSEKLLNELLVHAETDMDKAECLAEQTTSLSSIGNFIKAIETANRGLAYFGKSIPDDYHEADRRRQELMAGIAAKDSDVWKTILNMPFTKDRKSKIELAFYSELIPDLYMSGLVPQLYLSAAQSTVHCLEGGMDESVIYSFSIMGLQLGEVEQFAAAFKYEDLAAGLAARHPDTFGATRGMNGIVWCNMHSRSHPGDIADYCRKSIQCGKNCGDLYNAGLSYGPLMWNLQVGGADFKAVEEAARECLQFSTKYHLSFSVGLAEAVQAGFIEPMKKAGTPVPMEEKIRKWEQDNHIASAGSYYVHRALTHYWLGEHEEAAECLAAVRRYLSGLTDNVLKRQWHVFLVLNALKLYEMANGSKSEQELRAEITPLINKIETWAGLGPLLKPYLAFVYAELERVLGSFNEARGLYLDAVAAAHEQNYVFLEGNINEALCALLRSAGHPARIYFAEALRCYRRSGAGRKEINLIEKYTEYGLEDKAAYLSPPAVISAAALLPELDVAYLMKSALAISAEIEQDALLKKIMTVIIESSGAQHGYLLTHDAGNLFVRAESYVAEEFAHTLNLKLEDVENICPAVVRYVHRTGEKIIFNDASTECMLKGGADCRDMHLCSLLCLPVIKQARTIGIIYLENRLADGVFTADKVQITELLTAQAAIALENARLVADMKQAETEVKESLIEKEALLREIHHRVKNNLQIIHSMLNVQLPYIKDEQAAAFFKESQNRIYSMSLIHEKLYQSESLALIDLPAYVHGLVANLFKSYGVAETIIKPSISVEKVVFSIDTVIPLALIINELVTNALKHAFPVHFRKTGRTGEIRIDLRPGMGDKFQLIVGDNGTGLPAGFDMQSCESLGLKLVAVLARQLKGAVSSDRKEAGAQFSVLFRGIK